MTIPAVATPRPARGWMTLRRRGRGADRGRRAVRSWPGRSSKTARDERITVAEARKAEIGDLETTTERFGARDEQNVPGKIDPGENGETAAALSPPPPVATSPDANKKITKDEEVLTPGDPKPAADLPKTGASQSGRVLRVVGGPAPGFVPAGPGGPAGLPGREWPYPGAGGGYGGRPGTGLPPAPGTPVAPPALIPPPASQPPYEKGAQASGRSDAARCRRNRRSPWAVSPSPSRGGTPSRPTERPPGEGDRDKDKKGDRGKESKDSPVTSPDQPGEGRHQQRPLPAAHREPVRQGRGAERPLDVRRGRGHGQLRHRPQVPDDGPAAAGQRGPARRDWSTTSRTRTRRPTGDDPFAVTVETGRVPVAAEAPARPHRPEGQADRQRQAAAEQPRLPRSTCPGR